MIEDHALKQAYKEWHDFMGNHTEAEMKVVAHVTPLTYASMIDVMKEIRRLLGESAVKCKIFQFPVVNKRRTI